MGVKGINHPEKTECSNPQIENDQSERFANSLNVVGSWLGLLETV
jgi:hypothetical protein